MDFADSDSWVVFCQLLFSTFQVAMRKIYSLDELQHEVRDKLGRGDNEGPGLVERLGVVFNIANFPHQGGQAPVDRSRCGEKV